MPSRNMHGKLRLDNRKTTPFKPLSCFHWLLFQGAANARILRSVCQDWRAFPSTCKVGWLAGLGEKKTGSLETGSSKSWPVLRLFVSLAKEF